MKELSGRGHCCSMYSMDTGSCHILGRCVGGIKCMLHTEYFSVNLKDRKRECYLSVKGGGGGFVVSKNPFF